MNSSALLIYGFESQLRADLWFSDKARIQIGTKVKGKIRRRGKLLEKRYRARHQSSREFFADFRLSLRNAIDRHRRIHGRYVDFRAFDRIGPYIDWRAILKPSITD